MVTIYFMCDALIVNQENAPLDTTEEYSVESDRAYNADNAEDGTGFGHMWNNVFKVTKNLYESDILFTTGKGIEAAFSGWFI